MSDGVDLRERDPISDDAYRVLLDLYMVADPWPLTDEANGIMFAFMDAEAHKRGFDTWVDAYHEFKVGDGDE